MKRTCCVLLALFMLLALSACGASGPSENAPAPSATEAAAVPAPSATEAAAVPEATAAPEPTPEAKDMLGEKEENVYRNDIFGIRASFPEGWAILSDEQAAEMTGAVREVLDKEELAKLLEESGAVCDLYALNDENGDNVNIQLQKLEINRIQSALLTEEMIVAENVKTLPDMLEGSGMEIIEIKQVTIPFAGKDHPGMELSLNIQGAATGYERVVILKHGNYLATITSFSLDAARADDGLNCFEAA